MLTTGLEPLEQDPERVQRGPGCRELAPVARALQESGILRDTGHPTPQNVQ